MKTFNRIKKFLLYILMPLFTMNLMLSFNVIANATTHKDIINFDRLKTDVSYLASDELQGRKAGSKGIAMAATYIAKQFADIGLQPLTTFKKTTNTDNQAFDTSSYFQPFNAYKLHLNEISARINDKNYSLEEIAIFTNQNNIHWRNKDDMQISYIGADDIFSKKIRQITKQANNNLVLVNKKHLRFFQSKQKSLLKAKYQMPSAAPNPLKPNTLILVLSDETNITSVNIKASFKQKNTEFNNVVGVLPGKTKTNEVVIFSAHYDHLGLATKSHIKHGDNIFNGANDNASGTSAVIQLARYFQQYNNARTIIFVAFTAEEIGMLGSKYFAQNINPDDINAMINIEMIGQASEFGVGKLWMTGYKKSDLANIMNQALTQSPIIEGDFAISPDPYPKKGLFYRSDNLPFAMLGVPAHTFSSTPIDKDQHYHQVTDEVTNLDLTAMQSAIATIAIAATPIIRGEQTPQRIKPKIPPLRLF